MSDAKSAQAATKIPWLKQETFFFLAVLEGRKSKTKLLADLVSGTDPLPAL